MKDLINQITTGDAKELAKRIGPDSISAIFCDPVYDRIDDYYWLAETAMRVLKPNSACLAWVSKNKLSECQQAMEAAGLTYQSTLFYVVQCKQVRPLFLYGLMNWTTPCLYFAKGRHKCQPFMVDTVVDSRPSVNAFEWQKNPSAISYWLNSISNQGDLIFDPFSGSGTVAEVCRQMNRDYIAFECDPERAEKSRQRVSMAQPPLFVFETDKQLTLDMAG